MMAFDHARTALLGASLLGLAAAGGCGGLKCGGEGDAAGRGANATKGRPREHRPVTEDGLEVILANPNKRGGPTPSKAGDRARQREREHLVMTPTTPDPHGGHFTLQEAVEGLPTDGGLIAEIGTDFGTLLCDLHADRAPNTVANFIGLARGKRQWWDARAAAWSNRPYYRGGTFYRVIPDYLIQSGDYLNDGTGRIGYEIRDENHPTLRHDRAGQLCMATQGGPNHNGGQFFITDGAAPRLDGSSTVFGQCQQTDIVHRIARVPQVGPPSNAPVTPIVITRLLIRRQRGGAVAAKVTMPQLPPGEQGTVRGASEDPSSKNRR